MSGGSQHNPNGRQSQLGSGWSPLQLQVANLLARAPQAHMASDRGVTWHTPTPPPHLYHVPAPSPPDPLQVLKNTGSNSVFRHTTTPPELYRHTPTPPDKHLMRHTPSPGDIKTNAALPPVDLYPHLAAPRDKMVRPDDLLAYARVGVDLSLSGGRAANGTPPLPPTGAPLPPGGAPPPAVAPALSVRDAPTINSLIARAAPRPAHARVDALLERLAPVSPHSVIVHPRAPPSPDAHSSEDSADSCGAPPGSKRKRKPERTVRMGGPPATPPAPAPAPLENGDAHRPPSPRPDQPHARRKTRSGSAETIDDIAAMIASTERAPAPPPAPPAPSPPPADVDKLHSVLADPDPRPRSPAPPAPPAAPPAPAPPEPAPVAAAPSPPPASTSPATPAAAPRRRSARTSDPEAPNVPVESPSEAKPAEPEAGAGAASAEPAAASFVEVENQLEKMFAGLEQEPSVSETKSEAEGPAPGGRARRAGPRRARSRSGGARKKPAARGRGDAPPRRRRTEPVDSASNASSTKSRGPYIQIVGPCARPSCVTVMNGCGCVEEEERGPRGVRGVRGPRGGRGLLASTLGLRYDAHTRDPTWRCVFCTLPPHHHRLGDLFGPYTLDTDCEEYRSLDEATRRRYPEREVWFHEACGVWAPGLVAAGARLWGLAPAVWAARAQPCRACRAPAAPLACAARHCAARAHLPCAAGWALDDERFRALCPRHAERV